MKKLLPLTGLVALLLLACGLQAEQGEQLFTKMKITLNTSSPPSTASSNATSYASSNWRNKWLVIAVEYTPVMPARQRHFWLDDATLTIRAAFTGQGGDTPQVIVFNGKSTFWTIPLDNRKHIVTMMVPPQLLDRYLPRNATASTSSTFTLEAVFRDRAGMALGTVYHGQGSWSNEKYAEYFAKLDGVSYTVNGAILPRHRTPWVLQYVDDFDLLRQDDGTGAAK